MKKTISIFLALILVITAGASVSNANKVFIGEPQIAPPTESTINGIPESEIYTPYDITGPYFDSY